MTELQPLPLRDWLPDWRVPERCEVEGCERRCQRVVFGKAGVAHLTFTMLVFACPEHGDEVESLLRRTAQP